MNQASRGKGAFIVPRHTRTTLLVASILLLLTSISQAQSTGLALSESETTGRVSIKLLQAETTEEDSESTEDTLPEIPETEVTAQPFPRNPLSNDTVLTPTRTAAPRTRVGSSVTVITEEQIRASGKVYVQDVLRTVPGLDVVRNGGPGQLTGVFLRGSNSQQTKVFLDGIPINDPGSATRAFDFGSLSLDNIERIEVLRGAQSTLYGSDAIGGVIYITTKRGNGAPTARFSTYGGTFDTFNQSASLSGGNDQFYYSVGGSFYETNGFSALSKNRGQFENDGFRNGTLSGRMGWIPTENIDIDYVFRYNDADAEIDNALINPTFGSRDSLDRRLLNESFFMRSQTRVESWEGKLDQTIGYNYVNYNRTDTQPEFFGQATGFEGRTSQVDYQANLLLWESCRFEDVLTIGGHYLEEAASSTTTPRRFRYNRSLFVQNQLNVGDWWSTTIGARSDFYRLAGSSETYQATTRVRLPDERTSIHGSIGTGFRAPAFEELFNTFIGNPNLQPERSKGWEYGVEYALTNGRFIVDATYFRNDFTNLIVFQFPFLNNVGRAITSGVELTGTLYLADATYVTTNYTHTDTRDRGTDQDLLRRPRHKVSVRLNHRFLQDRANLNFGYRWVGDRDDNNFNFARTTLDDYSTLDVAMSYDVSDTLQLFARVDNIYDEIYEETFGFATPRVSAFAGATITFAGSSKAQ